MSGGDVVPLKIGAHVFAMPSKANARSSSKKLYLLDIKLIEGGPFQFFNLASKILGDLKHLESKLS